ncbi:MAG: peptidase U32 family protein [Spirochaetia bacterium]
MNNTNNTPELLAPAGNLETALAAYVSGADAVYCGLGKYNAREMADNFSFDDMSRLSAYAKKHDKRYYLTFNTLLKQTELEEAAEQLYRMTELMPDGVIVQDLGIARLLGQFFPSLPIHASTQMGIHNSAGVAAAKKMGMERVILERQVTIDELEQIVARSALEIEVFIHGALCCSLSGKCLFSSWIGGWSGNRGRCKQPCRRRYYSEGKDGKKAGFFFSTQDLYTLDLVPDLKRIGVASLKIEGRLKKPSYVQSVVQAYRMVLDADDSRFDQVIGQAKQVLSGSFGRKWSHGFATREDMETVLQPENVGVSGLLIGSVKSVRNGRVVVDVQRKLHVGDRIRIQSPGGEESSGFTIRTLEQQAVPVRSVAKGEAQIPSDREAAPGSKVYKVSQSIKQNWPDPESLPLLKILPRVDLKVCIQRNEISVSTVGAYDIRWTAPLELEAAKKHGISTEEVKRVFSASGEYDFTVGTVEVDCREGLFMPPSLLKKLRREFVEFFGPQVNSNDAQNVRAQQLDRIKNKMRQRYDQQQPPRRNAAGSSSVREVSYTGKQSSMSGGRGIEVDSLYAYSKKTREIELPHFCPEHVLPLIKKKIDQAVKEGIRRFRITDMYQLELFELPNTLTLTAAYPLPVTNPLAAELLQSWGVAKVQAWIELDREGFESLLRTSPLRLEMYRYGRPFLLATRARVAAEGEISDPRGRNFYVHYAKDEHLTYIFPYEVLQLPQIEGFDEFYDYRHSSKGERKVSSFNFDTELV